MKKGFTLIELLAVIVILAIIALIATPIILGIINDAREESNERSVELYASAVRNGIAAHQLRTGEEVLPGTYNETKPLPFEVDYEGKVECTSVVISEDGKVSLEGCTVNGGTKEYSYGTDEEETPDNEDNYDEEYIQVHKPQYYSVEFSGSVGSASAPEKLSTEPPTGKNIYMGLDVDSDNKISEGYMCFVKKGKEYCLKAKENDNSEYETNKNILADAFKNVVDTDTYCQEEQDQYSASYICEIDGLRVVANSGGNVDVLGAENYCISDMGWFYCAQN